MRVVVDNTSGNTSGQTFSLVLNRRDRVIDIKKKIEKTQGIAVSTQELYHGEALLMDDLDIKSYNIIQGSHLRLVLSMPPQAPAPSNIQVIPQAPAPSNYNAYVEDLLRKNLLRKNYRQMLHQLGDSQVPPSNAIEAFGNQGLPAVARSNDDQMLHQTKQSLVPSHADDAFFNHSPGEMTLTDQDMIKMQGFLPASQTQGNVNSQESWGRNANNQDLLQRESSNTIGGFSFGEGRPLSNNQDLLQREWSNTFGEDRPLPTKRFTNNQSYFPAITTGGIINQSQVFRTDLVPSNSTEQRINTQDLLVRDNQVVQTEKSPPIREVINSLDSPAKVESFKKRPQKIIVILLPRSHDNKPMSMVPVFVYTSDKVKELRKEIRKEQEKTQQWTHLECCFFKHKQRMLDDDQSFEWSGVADGDTIEIIPEQFAKVMRVMVLPYSYDNKYIEKVPVNVNASDKVKELRKELEKIQARGQLNLPQEGYGFFHGQRTLNDDESFEWNHVAHGATIVIFPGHAKDHEVLRRKDPTR